MLASDFKFTLEWIKENGETSSELITKFRFIDNNIAKDICNGLNKYKFLFDQIEIPDGVNRFKFNISVQKNNQENQLNLYPTFFTEGLFKNLSFEDSHLSYKILDSQPNKKTISNLWFYLTHERVNAI